MEYYVYDRTNIAAILSDEEGYTWNKDKQRWGKIDPMEILGDEHAFEVGEDELGDVLKSFNAPEFVQDDSSAQELPDVQEPLNQMDSSFSE